MPDICMCEGTGCPVKQRCYRATATPHEFWQSYFVAPPWGDDGDEACLYFIPNYDATKPRYTAKNKKERIRLEAAAIEPVLVGSPALEVTNGL